LGDAFSWADLATSSSRRPSGASGKRCAVGLITTHDFALAQIADRLGARAANVHFEGGEMTFDYRLRPGVVQHSNALGLRWAVGLNV
jgi:DNA mismatch repair ATPase MutS